MFWQWQGGCQILPPIMDLLKGTAVLVSENQL
jgi:hypothetical protein